MVRTTLNKYFPTKPILFTIGNNDLFVHDQLAENSANLRRLFLVWRHYIPRDQWETFATKGYYTLAGYYYPLDMIVMNTQSFYAANKQVQDCSVKGSAGHRQLKWLRKQLRNCRKKGASAYLIGHVPPSSDQYYPACQKKLHKLTAKYSDVIKGQFYGHTNYDEFFVNKRSRKKGVFGLTAPSMVPIFNSAFRILEYDLGYQTFGRITDYFQYYVDLEDANQSGEPRVQLEYQASEAYGPGPLTFKYFRQLKTRIGAEADLRSRFKLYRVVNCVDCLERARRMKM